MKVSLEFLDLQITNLTDVGLQHLHALGKLQYLNVTDTEVTDADFASRRKIFSDFV